MDNSILFKSIIIYVFFLNAHCINTVSYYFLFNLRVCMLCMCVGVCMYGCMDVCMYVCMYVCLCVCVCMYADYN